jgi:hypothetical protein
MGRNRRPSRKFRRREAAAARRHGMSVEAYRRDGKPTPKRRGKPTAYVQYEQWRREHDERPDDG